MTRSAPRIVRFAGLASMVWLTTGPLQGADDPWTPLPGGRETRGGAAGAAQGARFLLQAGSLDALLAQAPLERTAEPPAGTTLSLPLPDGTLAGFRVQESPVLSPGIGARYPQIRTYTLRGIGNGWRGRLDRGPNGVHALVLTDDGPMLIRPAPEDGEGVYASVFDRFAVPEALRCQTEDARDAMPSAGVGRLPQGPFVAPPATANPSGDTLRVYRLAIATTGEYYAARGGNDAAVLASIVTEVNSVNVIYEGEVAIRLVLIDDTDDLFFTDPTTDGYSNTDPCTMKDENQGIVDGILDDDDYDIAHVLGTSPGGGCAAGSVVCVSGSKARGASGLNVSQPPGHEGFGGYRLMSHEMGHQFSASHTFSGSLGSCTAGQWASSTSYEPGSGTTLMSYSGICSTDNIQSAVEDTYFHTASFDQVVTYSTTGNGDSCPLQVGTGNSPPDVDAGPDFTIPRQTPFVLTGTTSDPDGDPRTHAWEQLDLAPAQGPPNVDDGIGPLFRSFPPVASAQRTLPQLSDLLNNTTTIGELLPQVDRFLTFRLTARDNAVAGGGVDHDTMIVTVAGDPFRIVSPNGGEAFGAGCSVPVSWLVGGGSVAALVDLLLSDDGGFTFATSLAAAVPNDGAQSVALPCAANAEARVKAQAVGNIFFDISNADFQVQAVPPAIAADATGGEVDEACRFTVPFTATVGDDCAVSAAAVVVEASVLTGNASLGTPSFNAVQVNPTSVAVQGSVLVYDLTSSPAIVRVTVRATDACGFENVDTADVDVFDSIPPSLDAALSPSVLWPPNHQLVGVTATVVASDNCPGVAYVLSSVTSSEPENGTGDGDTAPDIAGADLGTPDLAFDLRAERSGSGPGRTYTAIYTATDGSGNDAQAAAVVLVPKKPNQ